MNEYEWISEKVFTSMKIYHVLRKTVFLQKCYKILFCTCNPHVLLILKILHKCVIQIYTLNWIHQSFPGGPHEPSIHRNPLCAKVVGILDTGHHLTSNPKDIITLECSVKDFIMNIIQSCVLIACIEIALSKNGKGEVSCNVNITSCI